MPFAPSRISTKEGLQSQSSSTHKAALRSKWRRSRLNRKLITTERKCRLISKATLPRPQPPAIPGAVQCFHSHPITNIQCPPSSLGDTNEATTFFSFFFFFKSTIFYTSFLNLFLVALGLHCCAGFSLAVESRSYSLVVVCRLLIKVASLVVEHGLQGRKAFSGCCSCAQQLGLLGSRVQAQ